jgi:dTDP-4-dehydrorhamnose reductase
MQTILITGANGLLGQQLAAGRGASRLPFTADDGYEYINLDITDEAAVERTLVVYQPFVIVHAAAMTQPDECEQNREACLRVNTKATEILLKHTEALRSHFIYLSTDFVFDGQHGPYREEDATGVPVNYYGYTKLLAEQSVMASPLLTSIVRTSLVYGSSLQGVRRNIITWVKEQLEKKESIKVVSDQLRTPTYVGDLAKGIIALMEEEEKAKGIFHIAGKERLTPYDMALQTADFFKLDASLIEATDASRFVEIATRPLKGGLIINKSIEQFHYQPRSFREGLEAMGALY